MLILRTAVGWLVAACRAAMVVAFIAMMVLTLFQVANRYLVGLPVFWTEELIVFLLVWSAMLGLPVQLWHHQDIVVDFINFSTPALQRTKIALATLASVVFCIVLAWSGWQFASRGWPVVSPTLGLSRFWFFLPISFAAALSILVLVLRKPAPSTGGFD